MRNKAVYLAIGVSADGRKDVLGLWMEQTEGAKFWMRVMSELKNRGVNDILIAVVGLPAAKSTRIVSVRLGIEIRTSHMPRCTNTQCGLEQLFGNTGRSALRLGP